MKRIIALLIAVIVVVVLWSGAWLVLADQVRKQVLALADADAITTPRLTCASLSVGGFPFRFDVDCTEAKLVSGDMSFTIAGLRASVLVYRPTHVLASARGPINISDAFTGSQSRVTFASLEASARTDGWRIARISLNGTEMRWSDTLLGEHLIAQSALIDLQLGDIAEQYDPERGLATLAGYFQARSLVIPGFTIADGASEIEIEINGLPDDIRRFAAPEALAEWRAAGGRLKLVSAHLTDAPSDLMASGELALDPQGLLDGHIDIASTQVAERIKPYLVEPYATLALGNAAPDGSYANVLNFRAGTIFSGLVPIATTPPLF